MAVRMRKLLNLWSIVTVILCCIARALMPRRLWLAPAIFLIAGLLVLITVFKRQRPLLSAPENSAALDTDEQQRLKALLNDKDKPDA